MAFRPLTVRRLRAEHWPRIRANGPEVGIVDLFCGCGGLTLGAWVALARNGRRPFVELALDNGAAAREVYERNFDPDRFLDAPAESIFASTVGERLSALEAELAASATPQILLAGPPCQGHSDLNNHTRRADARNRLYQVVSRAAEILSPELVIVENVPAVVHDTAQSTFKTADDLRSLGYEVAEATIDFSCLGVAQRRRRHLLVAVRGRPGAKRIMDHVEAIDARRRSARWALEEVLSSETEFDRPGGSVEANRDRIAWLFETDTFDLPNSRRPPCHQTDHSYNSMYGRIRPEEPAQTITTGFGSMGQGRFIHPWEPRLITPHEAARLQAFPDYFDFSAARTRSALQTLIGNAVPHVLSEAVVDAWQSLSSR